MIVDSERDQCSTTELKIITTRVHNGSKAQGVEADDVLFAKGALLFPCGGQTTLEVGIVIKRFNFLQPSLD